MVNSVNRSGSYLELNGNKYALAGEVRTYLQDSQPQAIRTSGANRGLNQKTTRFPQSSFPLGVGWKHMRRETGRGYGGVWWTDCDIAHSTVTLGRLNKAPTVSSGSDSNVIFKDYVQFLNNFYAFVERPYDGVNPGGCGLATWDGATETWTIDWGDTPYPINGQNNSTSSSSYNFTYTSTDGDSLIIGVAQNSATAITVTVDGQSATQLVSGNGYSGSFYAKCDLFIYKGITAGSHTIVVTGASASKRIYTLEWIGLNTDSVIITGGQANGTGASIGSWWTPLGTTGNQVTALNDSIVAVFAALQSNMYSENTGGWEGFSNISPDISSSPDFLGTFYSRIIGENYYNNLTKYPYLYINSFNATWSYLKIGKAHFGNQFVGRGTTPGSSISDIIDSLWLPPTSNSCPRYLDSIVHGGYLYVAVNNQNNDDDVIIYRSSDAVTWTQWWTVDTAVDSLTASVRQTNTLQNRYVSITGFGDDIYCAYQDGSNVVIKATPDGSSVTTVATIPCATYANPKLHVWVDPTVVTGNDRSAVVLTTSANTYVLDKASTSYFSILTDNVMSGAQWDGFASTVGSDGNLYISLESGDLLQVASPSTSSILVTNVGPISKAAYQEADGLPTEYQGYMTKLLTVASDSLLCAYGGNDAGKYATILRFKYETGAWMPLYESGTANSDISTLGYSAADDATPRVFFTPDYTSGKVAFHLEKPFNSVDDGDTYYYKATGTIRLPVDDLADPHTNKAILAVKVDAESLSASTSGEYIELEDGLNDDPDDTNTRGNFLSGTKEIEYGSGLGTQARKVSLRLNFNRAGTNTNSPKMHEYEIETRLKSSTLRGFVVPVDVASTAAMRQTDSEEIWRELNDLMQQQTLFEAKIGADANDDFQTYRVEIATKTEGVSFESKEGLTDFGAPTTPYRAGIQTLYLEEVR